MTALKPLVLASASPRRRALLAGAGVRFTVAPVDLDETPLAAEDPLAFVRRMAGLKAVTAAHRAASDAVVLGTDTVVTLDGRILGKPRDEAEAAEMLRTLSGRRHAVITAWALATGTQVVAADHRAAEVTFRDLDERDVTHYVATGEPMDKAGAYGIQGHGGALVEAFRGDFSTVVGLPIGPVMAHLVNADAHPRPTSEVARRAAIIRGRIAAACDGVERDPGEVVLVGASKAQSVQSVHDALAAGVVDLGESYVQEWQRKRDAITVGPRWHFIGRLQRNKAKHLVGQTVLIHGVDAPRTVETIGRLARDRGTSASILIQVNLSAEETKGGVSPEALGAVIEVARGTQGVDLQGLMALPRPGGLAETRRAFRRLRRLRDAHETLDWPLPHLSMGMSGDYDAAVVEGATHVRVGAALFGPRPAVAAPQDVC